MAVARPMILLLALFSVSLACADGPAPIGSRVDEFVLRDIRGAEHRLWDYGDAKVVVLAVLGTECPLAKLYAPVLQELSERYSERGVVFLGVSANAHDSVTELVAFTERQQLTFPILKDVGNRLADAVGASRTPEVVVLDEGRAIRYQGRIDNRYGIGYAKDAATRSYLIEAIDSLLAGKPVETPTVDAVGCLIGRAKDASAAAAVTYSGQIAEILNRRCVECHREGEIAPFPLTDYESASGWAETIAEVVDDGRMPPWHAAEPRSGIKTREGLELTFADHVAYSNDRRLSNEEKDLLLRWAADGAPRGDAAAAAPPADPVDGWQLPCDPDSVVAMAGEPFAVPASGAVKYQYFRVDPGFTSDRWIKAAEVLPGNRAVVHHVLVFARARGSREDLGEGGRGFLAAYVPGLKAAVYPDGMAKLIPAGAELIFQVHYTPVGSPQTDLTKIGFVFADPAEVDHVVETRNAVTRRLEILPNEANQRFEARDVIPYEGARLLAMMPHMHLRGQAFRYTLDREGERRTLLDVPDYDFNWQTGYQLADPLSLKKGDRIICEAWYDNSEANLANPDPAATVRWGDQTWNEMMIGYYDVAVPLGDEAAPSARGGRLATILGRLNQPVDGRVAETFDRYDANGDGKLSADEIPDRLKPVHARLDRDSDGTVTAEELRPLFERIGN